jgi:hypothetical protein
MKNLVIPKRKPLIHIPVRTPKGPESSSSESSEELDYTLSPKTQFFPDRISTPCPPKRFPDDMVSPATPIERPLSLQDELNRAMETPGAKIRKTPPRHTNKGNTKSLREAMDIINYPIKTRRITLSWTQEHPEDENL